MALGLDSPLFGDFAFKPVRLRQIRRERRITVGQLRSSTMSIALRVVGQHGKQTNALGTGWLPE